MSETASAADPKGPLLTASAGLTQWMADQAVSFAVTTYQAGRLIFIGQRPDGSLRGHERMIEHCQGLWTDGGSLWASSKTMLWRFHNALPIGQATRAGAERLFVPREARVTGMLDVHDIAVGQIADMATPGPIFVATRYNCLATVSETAGFRPVWRPPFISALVPEDRCHLNGLAMANGRPAYVTAIADSDVLDGWRDRRADGGVVIDVASGAIVARGLSMPHSPRLGPDGRLWLVNSGTGELGWLEPNAASPRFTAIAFLPGFARGLALVGRFAVVGLSRPRNNLTFEGLGLAEALQARGAVARCGLVVIDTVTGQTVQWLRFEHTVDELYDVSALHGVRQAEAIGFRGEDLANAAQPEAA